jgi:iron complex outermembrane receptor protein
MVVACCLAAAPAIATAQHAEPAPRPETGQSPPAPTQLEPVVVTATLRAQDPLTVPAAVDVVASAEIRRAQPVAHLSEALQRIPGVVARNRQNDAQDLQISIRGFGARSTFGVRGIRLYNDDISATSPDGQGQVSHFDLQSAQRIEVLRGPFSALYGNASGGVVKLYTAPAPEAPALRAGVVAGSDGYASNTLAWHAPWGREQQGDILLDLEDARDGGYRAHRASRRDAAQLLVRGDTPSEARYTLLFNALDLRADDPQGLSADQVQSDRRAASAGALAFDTRKTVHQQQLGWHIEQPFGNGHAMVLTAYTNQRDTRQMLSVPVFVQRGNPLQGGGALALARRDIGFDARWQWHGHPRGDDLTVTMGVDHEVSEEHRRGYENFVGDVLGVFGALRRDERDRVASHDQYVQVEWTPAARWRLDAGLRRSRVDFRSRDAYITADNPDDSGRLAYRHASPVAGVLFRATPWLSVYANSGGGFETPTFAELAYRDDGLSGLNKNLRPSISRNHELGFRLRRANIEASAAVFASRTNDELVVIANQGGRSVYGNAERSRRRGIELAASGAMSDRWHYVLACTLLDARYANDGAIGGDQGVAEGQLIPGLARRNAWAELRWSPDARTDVVLQGRFTDRIYADDANSAFAPANASLDLGIERHFEFAGLHWRGFARFDNLLDRDIIGSVIVNDANGRYFEPAPGRNWFFGLKAEQTF